MKSNKFLIALLLSTTMASLATAVNASADASIAQLSTNTASIFQLTEQPAINFQNATHAPESDTENNQLVLEAARNGAFEIQENIRTLNAKIQELASQGLIMDFTNIDPKNTPVTDVYNYIVTTLANELQQITANMQSEISANYVSKASHDAALQAFDGFVDPKDYVLKATHDALLATISSTPFANLTTLYATASADAKYSPALALLTEAVQKAEAKVAECITKIDTPANTTTPSETPTQTKEEMIESLTSHLGGRGKIAEKKRLEEMEQQEFKDTYGEYTTV